MQGCAQFLYDFEDYAVVALGGLNLRVEWFVWHENSKGRQVVNGGEQHIEKDVIPFYMRFRLHRGKKWETATEEQFALEAKVDLTYEEDQKIAGELLFARVCRQTCHIYRGPFSDWVRKGNGRLRKTDKSNVKSVTLVGLRDKQLSELACRTNNDSENPNLEMEPLAWSEELGEPIGLFRTKRRIAPGEELTWDYKYTAKMLQDMQIVRQPDDFPVIGLQKTVKDHYEAHGVLYKCKHCGKHINVVSAKANKIAVHCLLKKHLGLFKNFMATREGLNGERKAERKAKQKAKRKARSKGHLDRPPRKAKRRPTRASARLREDASRRSEEIHM